MNALQVEIDDLPAEDRLHDDVDLFELLAETGDGPPVEAAERTRNESAAIDVAAS
jgi:hypothetical protein